MNTPRWETTVALAREVDEDCEKGMIDGARIARLARAVLELQTAMLGTARRAAGRPTEPDAPPVQRPRDDASSRGEVT
jgi:hypothetical protein